MDSWGESAEERVSLLWMLCSAGIVSYVAYYLMALVSRIDLSYHKHDKLSSALVRRCSLLRARYWPSPWIFSGHLDAVVMMKLRPAYDPQYRRETIKAQDGTTLLLDWAERPDMPATAPVLVLLSGVAGSGKSSYITYLAREAMQRGWRAVAVNWPGSRGEQLTAPRLSGASTDVQHVVDHVAARFPSAPAYGIGFSLGGFLLAKYLGEARDTTPLRASIICSAPWSQRKLTHHWKGWAKEHVYGRHFVRHFLNIYHSNPGVFEDSGKLVHDNVVACKTLADLHTHLHAPLSGVESMEDYFLVNDAGLAFGEVKVPTLVVHAINDPVVPLEAMPMDEIKKNPLAILALTQTGGHGGWCQGWWPTGLSWFEQLCLQYVEAHLVEAGHNSPSS